MKTKTTSNIINRQINNSFDEMLIIETDINRQVEEVIRRANRTNVVEQRHALLPSQQEDIELYGDRDAAIKNATERVRYLSILMDRNPKYKPKKK